MPKNGKNKLVSFVRGFRLPKQQDIDDALGERAPFSDAFKSSFAPLPAPTHEADWLANYKEKGQSYPQFLDECPFLDNNNPLQTCIYLTLLDSDDRLSVLNIESLIEYTQRFFQMTVKIIAPFTSIKWDEKKRAWTCMTTQKNCSTKETTFPTRYNRETGHSQIRVMSVLNLLKRFVPIDARCLVAITLHDFYADESDLFIAGLAQGNNCRVAAFSFFRYDPRLRFSQEFWYDWRLTTNKKSSVIRQLLLLRSCRLLTHEICHLLGIDHCIYYACLMNGSGHLNEDFTQPLFLCPIDLRKLIELSTTFDIIERYERLLEFCMENKFEEETNVLKNRLAILKKDKETTKSKKNKSENEEDAQEQQRAKRIKKK